MKKLIYIDNEYPHWVSVNCISLVAKIADTVQVINCDTRDFAIGWQFEKPKVIKKADCNWERWHNEGLAKLYSVLHKQNREKYTIEAKDILSWLDSLCKVTGGYGKDWRYLQANVKDCGGWNLKYIRFVRNDKCPNEFVVCNSYMCPIEYRNIIDNIINKELL